MTENLPAAPDAHHADDELRVPFWIVLAGVGAGAFWALAGVGVGAWVRGRHNCSGCCSGRRDIRR